MSRAARLEQERAILSHQAHLNLLRGLAAGIGKVLPDDLGYLIITFDAKHGGTAGYVSNGHPKCVAMALKTASQKMRA